MRRAETMISWGSPYNHVGRISFASPGGHFGSYGGHAHDDGIIWDVPDHDTQVQTIIDVKLHKSKDPNPRVYRYV
eukprot:9330824-Karenia_brevis.AAC.1